VHYLRGQPDLDRASSLAALNVKFPWLAGRAGDEVFQLGHVVPEIFGGHRVGEGETDGCQFPDQESSIGLGPCGDVPVSLNGGAIPVVLAVLGKQDQRGGVSGLGGEGQVEQDEWERIPMADKCHGVQQDPDDHQDRLDHDEPRGAQEAGDALGEAAERAGIVMLVAVLRCFARDSQVCLRPGPAGCQAGNLRPPLRGARAAGRDLPVLS
jgi:hypothetical protein